MSSDPVTVIGALLDVPHHLRLRNLSGRTCPVWRNPDVPAFAAALRRADPLSPPGLRVLLTASSLFLWQDPDLPHAAFEQLTGEAGLRAIPGSGTLRVNHETVALPEHFPWIFGEDAGARLDVEARRAVVTGWLDGNPLLRAILPGGFILGWYA